MHWLRDPEIYYFSVFGDAGGRAPVGLAGRRASHRDPRHDHWQYLRVGPAAVPRRESGGGSARRAQGPADPSRGRGPGARALLGRLDAEQKARAVVDPVAPDDILTKNYRVADPEEIPDGGITLAELRDGQRDGLIRLLQHYVERKASDLAANEWRKIEQDGLDGVRFMWAGPEDSGLGALLRASGTGVRDRVRQHAERGEPHPLGDAQLRGRLGRGPAGRALRAWASRLEIGSPFQGACRTGRRVVGRPR